MCSLPLICTTSRVGRRGEATRWVLANANLEGIWSIREGKCLYFLDNYISVQFEII